MEIAGNGEDPITDPSHARAGALLQYARSILVIPTPIRDLGSTDNAITHSSPHSSIPVTPHFSSAQTLLATLFLPSSSNPFPLTSPPSTYTRGGSSAYIPCSPFIITMRIDICKEYLRDGLMALPCENYMRATCHASSLEAQEIDSFGLNDDFLRRNPFEAACTRYVSLCTLSPMESLTSKH